MSLQRKLGINEYYCPLIDYPNYTVSNYGNVQNKKTNRILKPSKNNRGYLNVILYNDNKTHHKCIHTLVLNAFSCKSDNKKYVEHIDNKK